MLVLPNHVCRCSFETQPGEIPREPAYERLRKRQNHHQQARVYRVEFWFDPRSHHVRKRHAKSAAQHQIRNDAQARQKNSESKKKDRQRKPFNAAKVFCDLSLWRRIDGLEKSFTENPVIDNRAVNKPGEARSAVDLTAPFRCAGRAEEDQMFKPQQRFRFAIAVLLFQKSAQRKPSMMPNDGGRAERDYPSSLLNSPAEIHVVAGLAVFRIESTYTFEGPTVKRHVTTGNMLGDCVRKQNMVWSARRCSNAGLNPILCRWRDVRSSYSGVIATDKRANQVVQPIGVCHAVRIGVGQHLALGSSHPGIAGVT